MKPIFFLSAFFSALSIFLLQSVSPLVAQETIRKAFLAGTLKNSNNAPVNFASAQIVETKEGRLSDKNGQFLIASVTQGTVTLRIKQNSYEIVEQIVELRIGDTTRIDLTLYPKVVTLKEAVVGASAFTTGEIKGVTLRPLDVVTTPGAAADIFRALQTFPGVANADDGSTLIVRGGDANETVSLLDQATIVHPYRYESPSGGAFGTIPPFFVSGTMFTSGGFPARYGNALSGVLAMESQNIPMQDALSLNLGMFGASVGVNWAAIPDKLGIRFSGNRTDIRLILALNGAADEFPTPPASYDANLSVVFKYSASGKFKLFNYATQDELGVKIHRPAYGSEVDAVYRNSSLNRIHSLQWSDLLDDWLLKASVSWNAYSGDRSLGQLTIKPADNTYKWRFDAEKDLSENFRLLVGQEVERTEYSLTGRTPAQGRIYDPNATVLYPIDAHLGANRWGGYAEVETKFARQWLLGAGVRADYHTIAQQLVFDPRVSLRYAMDEFWNIRASWGVYHQFPQIDQFNSVTGNPLLQAQQAQHYILGVDYQEGDWLFRVEAFSKQYDAMVIRSLATNLGNLSNGYARGVDVFLKYGAYLVTPISGWISYSYLTAQRLQTRDVATELLYETAPAAYDLTNNFTVVLKNEILPRFTGGFTFRYGTGAPVTPIVGGAKMPDGSYQPIEGAVSSERLADYIRLDLSFSYFYPFATKHSAVFFASINDVTNEIRTLGYNYSTDYSVRTPRQSTVRRTLVVGAMLSLGL